MVSGSSAAARLTVIRPPVSRLAKGGEVGQCQHGQGDVTVPADPGAHFILVQPDLALGLLEQAVSRPEELPLRPLAEPDVNLSAHPAPIIQFTTRMS